MDFALCYMVRNFDASEKQSNAKYVSKHKMSNPIWHVGVANSLSNLICICIETSAHDENPVFA